MVRGPVASSSWMASARAAMGPRTLALSVLVVLLSLLAALPRLGGEVATPVTADEAHWFHRSAKFAQALLAGDARHTYQTGHPGVTTMWASALGMGLAQAQALDDANLTLRSDDGREAFIRARQAMGLVQTALLAVIVLLTIRLFTPLVGLLAGILLALDPWLVAHSRILHLDGLLAALIAISALTCLIRWQRAGGPGYLLLAGLASGLAVLTKSSALVLLPPIILLAAAGAGRSGRAAPRALLAELVVLVTVAALTSVLLWPAAQHDPVGIGRRVVSFGRAAGGEPHRSFLLGQQSTDPGPAFYLLTLAYRLSPLVVLGVVLWTIFRRRGERSLRADGTTWLLAGAVLVVVLMSLSPKKQDRYVLPAVPFLAVAAAGGYQRLWIALPHPAPRLALLGVVALSQLILCASARPYFFTYYSPLLGGLQTAQYAVPVGWGEGLEPVALYLNREAATHKVRVAVPEGVFAAFKAQTDARPVTWKQAEHTYTLTYINGVQRGLEPPPRSRLLLTVQIEGVDYARLYLPGGGR